MRYRNRMKIVLSLFVVFFLRVATTMLYAVKTEGRLEKKQLRLHFMAKGYFCECVCNKEVFR